MVQFTSLLLVALATLTPLATSYDPRAVPSQAAADARTTKTVCTTYNTIITYTETLTEPRTRTSTYYVAYPITTWATNTSTTVFVTTPSRTRTVTDIATVSQCVINGKK
ncbi:hypothetical protein BGZ60DRAFT_562197 [Tricladium varicosporioides]|nr:hypothetical protein BGZ60DRAFT_562197 [Hymenoscyphus varicosporioides]